MSCRFCDFWSGEFSFDLEFCPPSYCIRFPTPVKTNPQHYCGEFKQRRSFGSNSRIEQLALVVNEWSAECEKERREKKRLQKSNIALRKELKGLK